MDANDRNASLTSSTRALTPLEQLQAIRTEVEDRVEVYVDGGTMSGGDVIAAVAKRER